MSSFDFVKFIKNIVSTLGRQIGSSFIQLAILTLIARYYGPKGNGIYTVSLLLPLLLASFFNLGIGASNVYFISSKKISSREAWRGTIKIYGVLCCSGVLIGAFILHFFSEQWFQGVEVAILWLALCIFPFTLLLELISSFFQGLQRFHSFNLVLLMQPVITLLGVGILIYFENTQIKDLLLVYLLSLILTLALALKNLLPMLNNESSCGSEKKRQIVNYGLKSQLSNIITFINYKADIFLINYFIGPIGAGIYVVSVRIVEKLWVLSTAISTVLLPKLSELSHDEEGRKKLTPFICRWTLFITFFGAFMMVILTGPVINWFFGFEYQDAIKALYFLAPGVVLWAASRILSNDIASRGIPEVNFYISVAVLVINITFNLILIPRYGLNGAAMATSIAYGADFLLKAIYYVRLTDSHFFKLVFITRDETKRIFSHLNLFH